MEERTYQEIMRIREINNAILEQHFAPFQVPYFYKEQPRRLFEPLFRLPNSPLINFDEWEKAVFAPRFLPWYEDEKKLLTPKK